MAARDIDVLGLNRGEWEAAGFLEPLGGRSFERIIVIPWVRMNTYDRDWVKDILPCRLTNGSKVIVL
jgi:hypothetical protein